MRILQVSAEIFPLLKTGGLADIAGALPGALQAAGCDVRVLLPGFPAICAGLHSTRAVGRVRMPWGLSVEVVYGELAALARAGKKVFAYIVLAPSLYDRPGSPYEDAKHVAYADNHRRFAAFGLVASHIAHGLDAAWWPQVVHCHDWHAALAPASLALWNEGKGPRVPSVYTVHNLAYQGVFGPEVFGDLGLPAKAFNVNGMEYYGQLSFMKAGLYYASRITTVSPTYAREIQTAEQGCGLDGLLRMRSAHVSGILNAVDETVWNPATDALIRHGYSAERLDGKAANKAALQAEMGVALRPEALLFTVVSRLTEQKGLPLVLAALDEIVGRGGQLLVLGNGERGLEQAFAERAQAHPGQVAVKLGYDETLAHRIFAGSDVTLVPSRFEPCGLTQMYGLKYGSLPLVRRVGGLADTVVDTDLETLADHTATGFVFDAFDEVAYRRAVRRAFALYARKSEWQQVRESGMRTAFDWAAAAAQYTALYRELIDAA